MWIDSKDVDVLIKAWSAHETRCLREIEAAKKHGQPWNGVFAVALQLHDCIVELQRLPRLEDVPSLEDKRRAEYDARITKWNQELWAASEVPAQKPQEPSP